MESFLIKKRKDFSRGVFEKVVLQSHYVEITLPHWCFPVNMLHICGNPFYKNAAAGLLLKYDTLHCLEQRKFKLS